MIPDFINSLNPKQKEAVLKNDGPLLILAGAGSGKTRVITHKIAYLIEHQGVDSSRIIALTFTNKAAQEMRERVKALLGRSSLDIWVSTFHSACVRILRNEIEKIGYSREFVIYDTDDSLRMMKECLKTLDINEELYPAKDFLHKISEYKRNLLLPQDIEESPFGFLKYTKKLYLFYQNLLHQNNALDFDDLLLLTIRLFEKKSDVLDLYRERFRHILVDEYQDTNRCQYRLLSLLAEKHRNICVVGDDDQSIYHWRGANLENILNFEKDYPDTHVVTLEENYRSTKTILHAAAEVVKRNEGRKEKTLWTDNDEGDKIIYFRAEDQTGEADYVAKAIEQLCRDENYSYRDIAVFYRTNAQSRVIEDSFRRNRLPYTIVKGLRFYERKEIKDILSYMKAVLNPHDSQSIKRIINVPPRGIGKTTCERIEKLAGEHSLSFFQAIEEALKKEMIAPSIRMRLEKFYRMMEELIKIAAEKSVSVLVREILERTGLLSLLEKDEKRENEARIENIKEFITAVEDFEKRESEPDLLHFLDYTALISSEDIADNEGGAISLMTLHSSKGLEFPAVFISGMENNLFPHARAFESMEELEEERRLCYVGMTRAKKKLFLTNCVRRTIHGSFQHNYPSLFLQDIPEEYIINVSLPAKAPSHFVSFQKKEEADDVLEGRVVHHPKFGTGVVGASEGEGDDLKVTVIFKKFGRKKLVAKYASLEGI